MALDSKHMMALLVFSSMLLLMLAGIAKSDISKDRQECAEQLVGLATCLPYVGGEAKTPTLDCCTGLKQVLQKSKKCLCVLIKDRNDPSLGLKFNATLALGLPDICHAPANISECPGLLNLPPNSPDAKIFEDYAKGEKKSNSTATPATGGSSAAVASDGSGKRKGWLGEKMGWGVVLIITVVFHFLATHAFDV